MHLNIILLLPDETKRYVTVTGVYQIKLAVNLE